MDPNANLAHQDRLVTAAATQPIHNYDRYALFDLRQALREWLLSGGYQPDWQRYPAGTASYRKWAGMEN